jgi:hypothetical protein
MERLELPTYKFEVSTARKWPPAAGAKRAPSFLGTPKAFTIKGRYFDFFNVILVKLMHRLPQEIRRDSATLWPGMSMNGATDSSVNSKSG